jgi:hypothetical protein
MFMPLFTKRKTDRKIKVTFSNGLLFVENENGKSQAFPLEWYPKLMNASEEDLEDWEQTGTGIHFNKLDTDVNF